MKIFLTIGFLLFTSLAYAQIPECQGFHVLQNRWGRFPCSVTVSWQEGTPNNETGFILERQAKRWALGGYRWNTSCEYDKRN